MPTITQRRKDELVQRASDHRDADRLRQGFGYFEGFNGSAKGCAIGCLSTSIKECSRPIEFAMDQYEAVERLEGMGVPKTLTLLAEDVFEAIPKHDRRTWRNWPKRFAQALPVGTLTDQDVEAFVDDSEYFERNKFITDRSSIRGTYSFNKRRVARAAADELIAWMRSL